MSKKSIRDYLTLYEGNCDWFDTQDKIDKFDTFIKEKQTTIINNKNNMSDKQTAIEKLIEKLKQYDAGVLLLKLHKEEIEQANKMFEQQIENAFNAGFDDGCGFIEDMKYKDFEQYYNETYGKKDKQ